MCIRDRDIGAGSACAGFYDDCLCASCIDSAGKYWGLSVSYTHLDVYKRQRNTPFSGWLYFGGRGGSGCSVQRAGLYELYKGAK